MAQSEVVTYFYTDPQGSVLAAADSDGNIIKRADYRPYGENISGIRGDGPGYSGHVSDDETGMIYMQQRYYDPLIGRFISVDPAAIDAIRVHNFARFTYGNSNPYLFIDKDGKEATLYWASATNVTATIKYSSSGMGLPFNPTATILSTQQRLSGLANVNGTIVNLTTRVQLSPGDASGTTKIIVVPDTANVTKSGRSETNRIGGDVVTLSRTLDPITSAITASHEFGRVAGAGDQYQGGVDVNGNVLQNDVPGDPNLMKDLSGAGANDQTLQEIINAGTNVNNCAPGVHAANGTC